MGQPALRSRRSILATACLVATGGCAWPPLRSGAPRRPDEPRTPSAEPLSPEELEEVRARIVGAHNKLRTEAKLKTFAVSRKLTEAAQAHAEDMAARRKMSHTGRDGSSGADRVKARGYRYLRTGENIAFGQFTVDRVMTGWMDSPPHRRNILGSFSDIGVGCAVGEDGKRYWCVNFGLPSRH